MKELLALPALLWMSVQLHSQQIEATSEGLTDTVIVAIHQSITGLGLYTEGGIGIKAVAKSPSGVGIRGIQEYEEVPGAGVEGIAKSFNGAGVRGLHQSTNRKGSGVFGSSISTRAEAKGVWGDISSTNPGAFSAGVRGSNNGTANLGIGVYGSHNGSGWGVYGTSQFGHGVYGRTDSLANAGVYGKTYSTSPGAIGVHGECNDGNLQSAGVKGTNHGGIGRYGVMGEANQGIGVYALTNNGTGVEGKCTDPLGYSAFFSGGKGVAISPRLGVNQGSPAHPIHVGGINPNDGNGAHVTSGGSWTNGSSRRFKEHFQTVDQQVILEKVAALPITSWEYRDSDEGRHLGPIAEDFAAAFGLGMNEKYISTVDTDGVALAAIQALYQRLEKQQRHNEKLQKRISQLEKIIAKICSIQR